MCHCTLRRYLSHYSHFTVKMCKTTSTFPSGCEWKHILLLYFVMVMFLENEVVPMDGCRSEQCLKKLLYYSTSKRYHNAFKVVKVLL